MTTATSEMDSVLSKMGLARKQITKDFSCLFRAVSERLFLSQCHHEHVKEVCMDYLERHADEYQPFLTEYVHDRIEGVKSKKVSPGHLEMVVLSRMYSLDFMIFHTPSLNQFNLSSAYCQQILLCYVEDSHYDLVYSKNFFQSAAICQSIVYEVLYRNVFHLDSELEEAVLFLELQKQLPRDTSISECTQEILNSVGPDKLDVLLRLQGASSPPVPYRIAKALHPSLYRNVELDIVQEEKRIARLQGFTARQGLAPGDKCQVLLSSQDDAEDGDKSGGRHTYNAHIQAIDDQTQTVLVFIEKLGIKETVPSDCVRPLPIVELGLNANLPVTNIDYLPFLKKNRRRKPMLIEGKPSRPGPSPHSDGRSSCRSNSVCSNDNNGNYITTQNNNINSTNSTKSSPSSYRYSNQQQGSRYQPQYQQYYCNNNSTSYNNSYNSSVGGVVVADQAPYSGSHLSSTTNTTSDSSAKSSSLTPQEFTTCGVAGPPTLCPYVPPVICSSSESTAVTTYAIPAGQLPPYAAYEPGTTLVAAPADYSSNPPQQSYCLMATQHQPAQLQPQQSGYWMPVVAVPYANNMGQVNLGWQPSQDPSGKDLPLTGY